MNPRPFPTSIERKREAHAALVQSAPDLMDEIAQLRASFPGSKQTYIQTPRLALGSPSATGWQVSDELMSQVAAAERVRNPPVAVAVEKKTATARRNAIKRKS